jgi:hypothetical protein
MIMYYYCVCDYNDYMNVYGDFDDDHNGTSDNVILVMNMNVYECV